jgi:hypothetical protein
MKSAVIGYARLIASVRLLLLLVDWFIIALLSALRSWILQEFVVETRSAWYTILNWIDCLFSLIVPLLASWSARVEWGEWHAQRLSVEVQASRCDWLDGLFWRLTFRALAAGGDPMEAWGDLAHIKLWLHCGVQWCCDVHQWCYGLFTELHTARGYLATRLNKRTRLFKINGKCLNTIDKCFWQVRIHNLIIQTLLQTFRTLLQQLVVFHDYNETDTERALYSTTSRNRSYNHNADSRATASYRAKTTNNRQYIVHFIQDQMSFWEASF